jgi:hypothetical protein
LPARIGNWEHNLDRPEPKFRASTFITALCIDDDGEMQLAAGSEVFELQLAEDESPEALRLVRVDDADPPEFD